MDSHMLQKLKDLQYFEQVPDLGSNLREWLLLEDSMTKKFENEGKTITVRIIREGFVGPTEVESELACLPTEPKYWLREIVLCADEVPWLIGRTVVPESTLTGPELALQNLGTTPLGRYLFSSSQLTRDYIEVGKSGDSWGRKSLFRLGSKPLVLTELFLSESPIYR